MDTGEDTIRTSDGLVLHYQWQRIPEPRGVILIVHGIGEHIGRYRTLEDWFCENGFTCCGYDQRGHGRSTGRRTHVRNFSKYVADFQQITAAVRERESGLPVFVYAHSMGTVVALLGVDREPTYYRGLIIASPAIAMGSTIPGWLVKTGGVLGKFLPNFKVPSLIEPGNLSHDPKIAADYEKDTLVGGTVTLGWLASMLDAQKEALLRAPDIAVPVLVLHSQADLVADISGTRQLTARLPKEKVTFHEYARPYHELHNEIATERTVFLNDVLDWLNRQLAT